ncbi:hypothetical protein BLOT_004493 [Blomia tropicalis]|nr:hypothetical protein BLOT_004493 [Blomia tropicalis]
MQANCILLLLFEIGVLFLPRLLLYFVKTLISIFQCKSDYFKVNDLSSYRPNYFPLSFDVPLSLYKKNIDQEWISDLNYFDKADKNGNFLLNGQITIIVEPEHL